MDNVYLKLLFLTFLVLGASSNANATYPAEIVYYIGTPPPTYSGGIEACDGYIDVKNATVPATHKWIKSASESSATVCKAYYRRLSDNSVFDSFNNPIQKGGKCGTTVTPNLTVCQGDPPPPPCPASSTPATYYSSSCVNGCEQQWNGQYFDMLGVRYYGYIGNTGTACTAGTANGTAMQAAWDANKAAKDAADAAAKAAKAAADKAAADAKNAADKAAASAAAKAAEAAKQAADEAVKKAEASKAAASSTSSDPNATQADKDAANAKAAADAADAAAKKDAAATAVGSAAAAQKSEAPEKQKDFCETNPNSMICKNSQINAGACSKGQPIGFQCEGDAILCGIAKSQVTSFCASQEKDDALVSSYDAMKTENGSNSPANSSKVTNINLPTSLNASSPYGAQCNPDVTVHVASSAVTLPFSAWCPYLNALGYLFLTMAYISGAVIISRT